MNNQARNKRLEVERSFVAQIIDKDYLLETTQIKPEYLQNKELAKLFKYMQECYVLCKMVNPVKMIELHQDTNLSLYTDLATTEIIYSESIKQQMDYLEDFILKSYKNDMTTRLNLEREAGRITYEDFINKVKEIDELQLVKEVDNITIEEMLNNINTNTIGIELTNFYNLNRFLKLVQGDLLVIGAKTGGGKSAFLLNLMNSLMGKYQCIYFNMEMSKSTIYKRMIAINAGVPVDDVTTPRSENQVRVIKKAMQDINDAKVIVKHEASDIKQIKNIVSSLKKKDKHTIVFIDHLGLTRCSEKGSSLYEQTTEVAKQLRQMCIQYDCTVIAASQLNRGAYGANEVTLNMLKDSGEVENSASKIILINYANSEDQKNLTPEMHIDVAKNRDGQTGIIRMQFDKPQQVFREKRN